MCVCVLVCAKTTNLRTKRRRRNYTVPVLSFFLSFSLSSWLPCQEDEKSMSAAAAAAFSGTSLIIFLARGQHK